jgi:hypothetical protein
MLSVTGIGSLAIKNCKKEEKIKQKQKQKGQKVLQKR